MSLDDSDDDLLPPTTAPPSQQHKDPGGIDLDDTDDDDDMPPPAQNKMIIEDSINLPPSSPKTGSGAGISLDDTDDDDDDMPPPNKPSSSSAAAAATPSKPTVSTKQATVNAPPPGSPSSPTLEGRQRSGTRSAKPQRKISDVSAETFLFKQSPSWPYAMQKRWVVLKGRLLSYFEEKSSTAPSGTIDMKGCQIIDSPPAAKSPHALGITGETAALKGRVFIFAAQSREEYLQWLDLLKFVTTEPRNNELHWFEKMAQGIF